MAAGDINTASGCKVSLGSNNNSHADPTTDTYTDIGFITNAGQFGRVYSLITFDSLPDRNTLKFKGQRNDGEMTLQIGYSDADAGQIAIAAALDSDADYNWKVELNDSTDTTGAVNTTFYFLAKIMSRPVIIGGPNGVVQSQVQVAIKSNSIQHFSAT